MEVYILSCDNVPCVAVMGSEKYAESKLIDLKVKEYKKTDEFIGTFDFFCKAHIWVTQKVPFYAAENCLFFNNKLP